MTKSKRNIRKIKEKKKKKKMKGRTIPQDSVIDLGVEEFASWGTDKTTNTQQLKAPLKRKLSGDKILSPVKKSKKDKLNDHKGKKYESKESKTPEKEMKGRELPDMSAWKSLFVPDTVLKSLAEDGFVTPTPIQTLALPSAIRDRMDIVGAAQTGSGKTLAFGIPLIHNILRFQENARAEEAKARSHEDSGSEDSMSDEDADGDITSDDEASNSNNKKEATDSASSEADNSMDSDSESMDQEADTSSSHVVEGQTVEELEIPFGVDFGQEDLGSDDECDLSPGEEEDEEMGELKDDELGCVKAVNNVVFDWLEKPKQVKVKSQEDAPLLALVLCPTRELAIQVTRHIERAARYTDIKIATVVGGMSSQKQERVLKKHPEIVVATPGRLWELIQQGEPHLGKAEFVKFLVIDEADRMVEKGHFQELTQLLELINSDDATRKKRQTFVFSATLTFVHAGPDRFIFKKKKKFKKMDEKNKLDSLMQAVGLKDRPKVIDLSRKEGTAETLVESRIVCDRIDKDLYLYYFTQQYPGRTLVFANSKDCIRRLVSLCTLLQCRPLPLHADMHQRQRLKNLDRFKADHNGLLLATDVAARGLDIPDVQHVIHYQAPRTTENYIHRSGRTARASKEGLSVMLVSSEDAQNYKKIVKTLNKDEDLPTFPVERDYLKGVKERVILATKIDKQEHVQLKQKRQNSWFERSAKEVEIVLDEDQLLHDMGDSVQQAREKNKFKQMKLQLESLLRQPVVGRQFSGRYPTQSGRLVVPCDTEKGPHNAAKVVKLEAEKVKGHVAKLGKKTKGGKPLSKRLKKKQMYSKNKQFAGAGK